MPLLKPVDYARLNGKIIKDFDICHSIDIQFTDGTSISIEPTISYGYYDEASVEHEVYEQGIVLELEIPKKTKQKKN